MPMLSIIVLHKNRTGRKPLSKPKTHGFVRLSRWVMCYHSKDHENNGKNHRHVCAYCILQGRILTHPEKDCLPKHQACQKRPNGCSAELEHNVYCYLYTHRRYVGHVGTEKMAAQGSCRQTGNLAIPKVRTRLFYNSLMSKRNIESLLARGNKQRSLRQGHSQYSKTTNDITRAKSTTDKSAVKCRNMDVVSTTVMSPIVLECQQVGGNSTGGVKSSVALVEIEQIESFPLTVTPNKWGQVHDNDLNTSVTGNMCDIDAPMSENLLLYDIKLHLRVFLLLKVSNIFHYWPLSDFDHI